MLAERITSRTIDRTELTPFPTYCSGLSVVAKNANSFGIKQVHTLPPKHPAYGYPERIYDRSGVRTSTTLIDFYTLCFHALTKPFFRNPFAFTSIQNGGRARSTGVKSKWKKRQAGFQRGK